MKIIFIIIAVSGCSLLAKLSIPKLELRTLWISKDKPGFYYTYCVKKKFLSRKCKSWKTDFYDFNDEKTRLRLKNMGFKLKVHNFIK